MSGRAGAATLNVVDTSEAGAATVVAKSNPQTHTFTFTATNTAAITFPGSTTAITGFAFDMSPLGNASTSGLNGFTGVQAPMAKDRCSSARSRGMEAHDRLTPH